MNAKSRVIGINNLWKHTNLLSPAVWTTNSPVPVVADGHNTITNSISGARQFYRLKQ